MCEDPQQTEDFLRSKTTVIRASGLLFAEFFVERFFSHVGGLAIATTDGQVAFVPLRFFCKELNMGAKDLLQFKLPTLENLLRDPAVYKVV